MKSLTHLLTSLRNAKKSNRFKPCLQRIEPLYVEFDQEEKDDTEELRLREGNSIIWLRLSGSQDIQNMKKYCCAYISSPRNWYLIYGAAYTLFQ